MWLSGRRQTPDWVHVGLLCVAGGAQAWFLRLGACRAAVCGWVLAGAYHAAWGHNL